MTHEIAVRRLTKLWLFAAIFFAAFAFAQMLAGKYGSDSAIPFNWLSAQILPVVGLILAAIFSSPSNKWKTSTVAGKKYLLALGASVVQIVAILLTILIEPVLELSPFDIFDKTIVLFGIWQCVVTACVGGLIFDGR
ncbi:hypothetical protein [Novosphingobium sp. B 225]|uniref:hypothetical protein n=1 Tax=Novosphingobium sp. B 225 TaxID=1961849 RepID=UPI000B4BF5F7|nr:hypothetical protein [Novosphingobium sp. B 225]